MKVAVVRAYTRKGRLTPAKNRGLRARAVTLPPGGVMPWHSTRRREELLLVLQAVLRIEIVRPRQQVIARPLRAGQALWLPAQTIHRVMNAAQRPARYVYVTG